MQRNELVAILLAIMLSGYSGAGGFEDEQITIALDDVRRILEAVAKLKS